MASRRAIFNVCAAALLAGAAFISLELSAAEDVAWATVLQVQPARAGVELAAIVQPAASKVQPRVDGAHLLSYVSGKLGANNKFAADAVVHGAKVARHGVFAASAMHIYSEPPGYILSDPRWERHLRFLRNASDVSARGGGYWFWKSVIIAHHLAALPEGSYLIYSDFDRSDIEFVPVLLAEMCALDADVAIHRMGFSQRQWTKRDVYAAFGIDDPAKDAQLQYAANWIALHNTPRTRALVDIWIRCVADWHLVSDEPSVLPTQAGLWETRHDQSMLSLLLHANEIVAVESNVSSREYSKNLDKCEGTDCHTFHMLRLRDVLVEPRLSLLGVAAPPRAPASVGGAPGLAPNTHGVIWGTSADFAPAQRVRLHWKRTALETVHAQPVDANGGFPSPLSVSVVSTQGLSTNQPISDIVWNEKGFTSYYGIPMCVEFRYALPVAVNVRSDAKLPYTVEVRDSRGIWQSVLPSGALETPNARGAPFPRFVGFHRAGQLCNQLYEYATAWTVAAHLNASLCSATGNARGGDDGFLIDHAFVGTGRVTPRCPACCADHVQMDHGMLGWTRYTAIPRFQENAVLHGFAQSFKYFLTEEGQPLVASLQKALVFQAPFGEVADRWHRAQRTTRGKRLVSVHIRRGDRVKFKGKSVELSPAFFGAAMDLFRAKNIPGSSDHVFVVASDDYDWVRAQAVFHRTDVVTLAGVAERSTVTMPTYRTEAQISPAAVLDLAILARCDDAILSVGTFSLWSALLHWGNGTTVYNPAMVPVADGDTATRAAVNRDIFPPSWVPLLDPKINARKADAGAPKGAPPKVVK